MMREWRRRRAVRRVEPGDGRPLKRFRWWQVPFRALFHLRLTHTDGRHEVYSVDVRHGQNQSSGNVRARLYLGGRLHSQSRLPAVLPVPGGVVEVRMSGFGLKRCHYVTDDGAEHQLTPDPASAEGRRARLDRSHPALSRCVATFSAIVLVAAVAVLVPQLVEQLTAPAAIAQHTGRFHSPVDLPKWANIAIGLATAAASTERALRLRYSRLLDGAAG
ncbi:hypothetical protein [Streptomyces endophyticus]|uniref:Uncharacterized protein n=1 Tax=Streptomyces endophyticus TaxID=714166 RepID=A0ABU6EZK8_9ACTN|nr:hypothetical protein [Streptomyces endophyticus]MEB8336091.1 hypothetical protein [Streptomyces endophyticus]